MSLLFFTIRSLPCGRSTVVQANPPMAKADSSTVTFNFIYACTAHLTPENQLLRIASPGSTAAPEQIGNGTVSGPSINATITGDIATPAVYKNGILKVPVIPAWGVEIHGFGFATNELGAGTPREQVTRIVNQSLKTGKTTNAWSWMLNIASAV